MHKHLQNLTRPSGQVTDQREINFVVDRAFKIALNYLKLSYVRVQKLINIYEMSYEDIAIDSIAPLFVKNQNHLYYPLISSYMKWKPPVKNEADALFFLNKMVASRVEQHITCLFREADPVFGKILDSINYFVEKKKYKKINYLGCLYIVEGNCRAINGKVIDPSDFEFLPLNLFYNKQTALTDILDYIKTHSDCFPAVPMNAFAARLKRLSFINANENPEMDFFFNGIEIEECVSLGLNATKMKLNKSYRETKKLTKHECRIIEKVLDETAFDLKNGGIHWGMYDYFVNHLPSLTRDEFKLKYHNIIEYLFKSMKDTIAGKLKD